MPQIIIGESYNKVLPIIFVVDSYSAYDEFIYGELIGIQDTEQDDGWGNDDDDLLLYISIGIWRKR